ncbi:ATP-binding protein [Gehongia tenuis]|uniref:Stage 0 sporulation protein A homolog n=1 Tax=Gehongia tenuis TaxID=2763655 RepID=A0A926D528_9FIRM|nr:transporter substrate-binding domain-containing protein [Gehongia tenuis]MBC8531736.1 transporter substrate-binding domain-containing protein [Gehongia tenuis]
MNNRGELNRYRRRFAAVLIAALLMMTVLPLPAMAAEEDEPRVLRVAFYQIQGMTETWEDGTRHGLVVDYLNEIAKYTNWEYEYIDVGSGEEMLERFRNGEFDLMGGNYYAPELEEYYGYPDYNTGYSRSVLLARRDDLSMHTNIMESIDGKTIGVYANAKENIRRLKEFLSINNLNCPIKEYSVEQLSVKGNLYTYLASGEVDLLLGNFTEHSEDFRIVVSYDSQPYYIVTTPGNQEVLDGLNMALAEISAANPNFGTERFEANFTDPTPDILLDAEELAYVQTKKTVTVAVPEGWHPLFCMTSQESTHDGVVPDILKKVEAYTGLSFHYVYAKSYMDAIHMVQEGRADILGFYLDSEEHASEEGLALTASYASLNNIVVRNKASSYPDDGLVGGIVEGRELPMNVPAAEVKTYSDMDEALAAVNRGKIDFVYGLPNRIELEIQHSYLNNVVPVTLVNDISHVGFALARPTDTKLLTILNKAINSLDAEEKDDILNRNLVSLGASQLSLMNFVYANPFLFAAILGVVLLIVLAAVILIARSRMKAAAMQSNLEKAEASSRAKGEFLSRMSHEIRTPMNAVVGLADLTSMMEDIPEAARANLRKLRTSSQYMLSLINDILDMSRIDNGMLSIADESFSLEQVLHDLQSMMSGEASRHDLSFTLEKKFTHGALRGDAVRLRQVLVNLLSNAFKFTPEGGKVLLEVLETGSDERGAAFTFRVVDSGMGIHPEDQERIFASFEQLGSNSSKSQGTGLGLAISSSIVRLMGEELKVKSQPGEGSEFYFSITLPFGEVVTEPEEKREGQRLDGVQVLIAEDNDLNAEIAMELLKMQGAVAHRAKNGALAVKRFEESRPGEFQIILMDVQMPEMNGLDATRAIRALDRPDAAVIPIVAMTANTFQEDVDAAKKAGMNDFLAKPLDVARLYRVLQGLING